MGKLIPFEFAGLGAVEFAWLALVFGGLSLVWAIRRRVRAAIWVGALMVLLGLLRLLHRGAGGPAWASWLGPTVVMPVGGAGLVLLGSLRERLRGTGGWVWLAALVVLSLAGQPFGLTFVEHAPEWLFLALVGVGVVATVEESGLVRDQMARRLLGRLRVAHLLALALVGLCVALEPFGVGLVGALALVVASWLVQEVLTQGDEMRRYVKRRLTGAPVVLVVLLTLSFFLMRSAPGGPFDKEHALDPAIKEQIEAKYGYDKPLPVQFKNYMVLLLWEGDLGDSTKQKGFEVNEVIANHAPHSARLGLAATCLAVLVGVTAGLISGIKQNSIFDYSSMAVSMLGLALPTFIVGPMLVLLFSMKLDWFRVTGWEEFPRDLILPAITLALPFMARIARLTRAGMLEIVNQDYIRTARAKGLSEPAIVVRHTLKGTLLPVVSFLGPGIAQLLTGSLVVETIFGVPGMGKEFVQSALNRDHGVAMGLVLVFGTLLILFNLVVDIVYAFLDPRIRHG